MIKTHSEYYNPSLDKPTFIIDYIIQTSKSEALSDKNISELKQNCQIQIVSEVAKLFLKINSGKIKNLDEVINYMSNNYYLYSLAILFNDLESAVDSTDHEDFDAEFNIENISLNSIIFNLRDQILLEIDDLGKSKK